MNLSEVILVSRQAQKLTRTTFRPIFGAFSNTKKNEINSKSDYYEILGVDKSWSEIEIKKAYFKLAKTLHPDVNKEDKAQENFEKISEAYNTLKDKKTRAIYDRVGLTADEQKISGYDFSNFGKRQREEEFEIKQKEEYDLHLKFFDKNHKPEFKTEHAIGLVRRFGEYK